jgi:ribonuclease P/MRP protein subunit RPP40
MYIIAINVSVEFVLIYCPPPVQVCSQEREVGGRSSRRIGAESGGMEFNVKKCNVMHLGFNNPGQEYLMDGQVLEETTEERDIGVAMQRNLKPSAQCTKAARTAQTVLSQMTRAFHYRDRHIYVRLYVQYVRPHLEFASSAWSPWAEADKEVLEKIQTRAISMVSGLKGKD